MQIVARMYTRPLYTFLNDSGERKGVVKAIRAVLKKYKCADVTGTNRYQVQRAVGAALGALYAERKASLLVAPAFLGFRRDSSRCPCC